MCTQSKELEIGEFRAVSSAGGRGRGSTAWTAAAARGTDVGDDDEEEIGGRGGGGGGGSGGRCTAGHAMCGVHAAISRDALVLLQRVCQADTAVQLPTAAIGRLARWCERKRV